MITIISTISLVLAAISLGLAIGNQSWQSQHKHEHDTKDLIRSSIDKCTQSQLKHMQNWLESTNKEINALLKKQEEER